MNSIDALTLALACAAVMIRFDVRAFELAILVGFVLGFLCWRACTTFSLLWNTRYRLKVFHHILCAFAAFCTLFAVILFFGLHLATQAATASLNTWEAGLAARLQGDAAPRALLDDAWRYLSINLPYIAPSNPVFLAPGIESVMPAGNLAAGIRSLIQQRIDRVAWKGQVLALAIFLLSQTLAFGLIARDSFRDIKVNT